MHSMTSSLLRVAAFPDGLMTLTERAVLFMVVTAVPVVLVSLLYVGVRSAVSERLRRRDFLIVPVSWLVLAVVLQVGLHEANGRSSHFLGLAPFASWILPSVFILWMVIPAQRRGDGGFFLCGLLAIVLLGGGIAASAIRTDRAQQTHSRHVSGGCRRLSRETVEWYFQRQQALLEAQRAREKDDS